MKKLYQLKKWLNLEETARHLSIIFGENVSEADILQLALDGHLKMSVYFAQGAAVRRGIVVAEDKAKMYIMPRDIKNTPISEVMPCFLNTITKADELPEGVKKGLQDKTLCFVIRGMYIQENEILEIEDEISYLNKGAYDLPMIGEVRMEIEDEHKILTDDGGVIGKYLDGTFVVSSDGQWCQLQEHFDNNPYANDDESKQKRKERAHNDPRNYYPAGGLPDDSVLVVRTDVLRKFEESIKEESSSSTELPAERRSRLKKRVAEEKANGNKAFNKTVASEENITVSRLKQILENKSDVRQPNKWQGLATPSRQTTPKKY